MRITAAVTVPPRPESSIAGPRRSSTNERCDRCAAATTPAISDARGARSLAARGYVLRCQPLGGTVTCTLRTALFTGTSVPASALLDVELACRSGQASGASRVLAGNGVPQQRLHSEALSLRQCESLGWAARIWAAHADRTAGVGVGICRPGMVTWPLAPTAGSGIDGMPCLPAQATAARAAVMLPSGALACVLVPPPRLGTVGPVSRSARREGERGQCGWRY